MRKLVVFMNITLDGFIAGPHCELDWHFDYWNEEMLQQTTQQLRNADTLLFGRVTYSKMCSYWQARAKEVLLPREEIAFVEMMNSYKKIVFSKTLTHARWNNAEIVSAPAHKTILHLKQMPGKDLLIYGSGSLVTDLIKRNMVDEYHLLVHPVAIGKGKTLFGSHTAYTSLQLCNVKPLSCGVVALNYAGCF